MLAQKIVIQEAIRLSVLKATKYGHLGSKPQSEKGLTAQNRFLTVPNLGLICGLVTGLN